MKISELIQKLQETQNVEGDIPVCCAEYDGLGIISDVDGLHLVDDRSHSAKRRRVVVIERDWKPTDWEPLHNMFGT